ncbi:hypothetical protein MBLNU13_g11078t2 [Cladosporium sp. NU13]
MSGSECTEYSDGFLDSQSLRESLECWFDASWPKGVIMCSRSYLTSPNPALEIENTGTVGLPLYSRDAAAIEKASHPAPFGKGSEKLIDVCAEQLGLSLEATPFIHAELYKLLLYEEVVHFKPHHDSEKAPGMFATLAICLPSQFEGGDLVLTFGGQKLVWNSSSTSLADVSIAAWYANVTHKVKPTSQGHRLALTYNVTNTQPAAVKLPTSKTFSRSDRDLLHILRCFNSNVTGVTDFMCHFLDHKYREDSLRMSRLLGADQTVVNQPLCAANRSDFDLFLATFEQMHHGGCDDYRGATIDDELDSESELQKMVDLEGNEVAKNVNVENCHFVVDLDFADQVADKEDFEGHTGNARAHKTLWYRRTVLVIMPKSKWISFMLNFLGMDVKNPELNAWSTEVLIKVLQTTSEMTSADAHALMRTSDRYGANFHTTQ